MKTGPNKAFAMLLDKWPLIIANLIAFAISFYVYGCEPKTDSILETGKKVTRAQLKTELEIFEAKLSQRTGDLDKQQLIRDTIFEQTLIIGQTGGANPLGIMSAIMAVLGVGATVDDIRLRKQRKNASKT